MARYPLLARLQAPTIVAAGRRRNPPFGSDSSVDYRAGQLRLGAEDRWTLPEMEASVRTAAEEPTGGRRWTRTDPVTGEVIEWTGTETLKPEWLRDPDKRGGYFGAQEALAVLEQLRAGRWPRTARRERIAEQIGQALYLDAETEKARALGGAPAPGPEGEEVPEFVTTSGESRPRLKVDFGKALFTTRPKSPFKGTIARVNPRGRGNWYVGIRIEPPGTADVFHSWRTPTRALFSGYAYTTGPFATHAAAIDAAHFQGLRLWTVWRRGQTPQPGPRSQNPGRRAPIRYSKLTEEQRQQIVKEYGYYRPMATDPLHAAAIVANRVFRMTNREWNSDRGADAFGAAVAVLAYRKAFQVNPRRRPSRAVYCPERVEAPGRFDPRSFRTIQTDGHLVTIGCPRGQYDARAARCRVGTRAQRILHPPGEASCPLPGQEVRNPLDPYETRLVRYIAALDLRRARRIKDTRAAGEAYGRYERGRQIAQDFGIPTRVLRRRNPNVIEAAPPGYRGEKPPGAGWRKVPSVTPGGKPYFWVRFLDPGREWYVWSRSGRRWEHHLETPDAPNPLQHPSEWAGQPLPIRPGDRVTFLNRFGQQRTGRVVFAFPTHLTLNMGGPHGTPAVIHYEQVVKVSRSGKNPLTRQETAAVLRSSRRDDQEALLHPRGSYRRAWLQGAAAQSRTTARVYGAWRERRNPELPALPAVGTSFTAHGIAYRVQHIERALDKSFLRREMDRAGIVATLYVTRDRGRRAFQIHFYRDGVVGRAMPLPVYLNPLTRAETPRILGTIPGAMTEIRYNRTGRHRGPYYHKFSSGVRAYRLSDGSVLLRGRKPLWVKA